MQTYTFVHICSGQSQSPDAAIPRNRWATLRSSTRIIVYYQPCSTRIAYITITPRWIPRCTDRQVWCLLSYARTLLRTVGHSREHRARAQCVCMMITWLIDFMLRNYLPGNKLATWPVTNTHSTEHTSTQSHWLHACINAVFQCANNSLAS